MNYRTDVEYKNGSIVASNKSNADTRKPLPELSLSDKLKSNAWGDSILSELAKFKLEDNHSINSAINVHKQMVETAQRFSTKRSKQDPRDTQFSHLTKLNTEYSKALDGHNLSVKRIRDLLTKEKSDAHSIFRDKLKFSDKNGEEIRQRIYGLDPAKRNELINQAVHEGDGNILSAILDAHPMLTGLTAVQQSAYQDMAKKKHAPELKGLEDQAEKIMNIVSESYIGLVEVSEAMTGKTVLDEYHREIEQAETL